MWDFSTDPEFQAKLDWMDAFVRDEVEPIDHLTHQDEHTVYAPLSPELAQIVRPLQDKVREQGLWACHLGPELGGQGYAPGGQPGLDQGPVDGRVQEFSHEADGTRHLH